MQWHPWSDEAFEQARERSCPVLLFLRAGWCRWSHALEQQVFEAPQVAAALNRLFVCVEVDKDQRPDLDERFRDGGWPTLAWIDAEGELVGSRNWIGADELVELAQRVAELYPERKESIAAVISQRQPEQDLARAGRAGQHTALSERLVAEATEAIVESADPVHGGWGKSHKFPHPDALRFAMVRWTQTGDARARAVVLRTLRNMQVGQIYDEVEGGFYRYATQPDWSVPNHEKQLGPNAARLKAYVEAYQMFGDESFRKTAEGILGWMQRSLFDPQTNAYRGSQDADPEYAHLKTIEARQRRGAPDCDPRIYANANAGTVMALLEAAIVFEEDRWRVQALGTLDFLVENLWDSRHGMYHYWDGAHNLPGLLNDQAHVLRALVAAMHFAGENRYLEAAHGIARYAMEELQAEDGAFYDEHERSAQARRAPTRSILGNALMAESLIRLSHLTRVDDYELSARRALESFLPDHRSFGHRIGGYARAVSLLLNPPVHVTLVGPRDGDSTRALREAALRPYIANRIVQTLDPEADREFLAGFGLPQPDGDRARAYVHQGRTSYAETDVPDRLPALMTRVDRSD